MISIDRHQPAETLGEFRYEPAETLDAFRYAKLQVGRRTSQNGYNCPPNSLFGRSGVLRVLISENESRQAVPSFTKPWVFVKLKV